MKRIWNGVERGLERTGIHLIALASLATFIYTTVKSNLPEEVPQPGSQHADPEPWLYDLSLGLLAAYAFNFLVVVLPARKKQASRLMALTTPLTTIAFNGLDMVRELERIAKCPHRRITKEHLDKVLGRIRANEYVTTHLLKRMEDARAAYLEIVPYAADLPLDLQEALQQETQSLLHNAFDDDDAGDERPRFIPLSRLREYEPDEFGLDGWWIFILRYYEATEAVRVLLEKYIPSSRGFLPEETILDPDKRRSFRPGRYVNMFDLHKKPEYPYWTYPTEPPPPPTKNNRRRAGQ